MQKSVSRFAWFGALCAAVWLGLVPPAEAQSRRKEPPPAVPPPAQPLAVKVKRGEPAEIALRIYGRKNAALKYLVRTEPRHGKLTAPRVVDLEVSTVTYTPPADLAITRDRFAYAVQSIEGVSAPVDVILTIVDEPPELTIPGALEFSPILAGATAAKSLEISNRGGSLAEGKVAVEAPWKIDGSPKYRLGAGERVAFKVVFAPEAGGEFESAVRFSSQPETSVPVRGVALAAIAATPAKVELHHASGDPVRTGGFQLTNQTGVDRRVMLSGGDRLQVPAELMVPAQGKVDVPVQTAAGDVAVMTGEVRVESDGLTVRVPVVAQRVGGIVRAARPAVAFGRVDANRPAGAVFELENIGGTAAGASWEIAAPFTTDETSTTLAPGERKTLAIRTQPAAAGKYRGWLAVKSDGLKLEIPVEAELLSKSVSAGVSKAPLVAGPALAATPSAEPEAPAPERLATVHLPPEVAEIQVDLIRPAGVGITRLEATSTTLEWPAALSTSEKFRFERRRIVADAAGELKVRWEDLPGVSVRRIGERQVAVFQQLRPADVYGVRVVPVGPGGEGGKPLFTQYFTTPARESSWPRITPVRVLSVVLAGCGFLVLRQRRAQRQRP